MAKAKPEGSVSDRCTGGKSFGCDHSESPVHNKIMPYWCPHCDAYLGCKWCMQVPQELLCLNCHNWATTAALNQHGPLIPNRESIKAEIAKLITERHA